MQVDTIRDQILTAQDPWVNGKKPKDIPSNKHLVHHITGGIYMGSDHAFVEALKDNSYGFECVISMCSYARIIRSQEALSAISLQSAEEVFKERKITWLQVGNAIPDDKSSWPDIVFNATFPDSEQAKVGYEIRRREKNPTKEQIALREHKRATVLEVDVSQYFSPIFSYLKEALTGKKTLVHCHHGVSRSGTLLCAFFIREFDVTAEQALAYLRTKRICAKPKLLPDLQQYAKSCKVEIKNLAKPQ